MPEILILFILLLTALLVIGPVRLPQGLEALYLALTDLQRSQRGQPPLESMHNARIYWASTKSGLFAIIQVMYRVSEHLEELRRRLLVIILAFGIAFVIAFSFAQPLLGFVIRPINLLPFRLPTQSPINDFVFARDVPVITNMVTATGTETATLTIPAGTVLPLSQATTTPVVLRPTEIFGAYIQVALIVAFGVALPAIVWELLMFLRGPKFEYARLGKKEWNNVRETLSAEARAEAEQQRIDVYEGLTAHEVRPLAFMAPLALVLFFGGSVFTYFLILPTALDFLFGLGGTLVQPLPALDDYLSFSLALIFWIGLAFETPLIMYFLARFRVISAQQFARQWRYAVVLIAVIAAVITPTVDPFSMSMVALPLLGLYVLGIVFARLA